MTAPAQPHYSLRKEVDFVIVGSGAAGGILAKELATAGFDVVVLEQGPYRRAADFTHDELGVFFHQSMRNGREGKYPQTFRRTEAETAQLQDFPPPLIYARGVGGSSVHFTANYWRLRPSDFHERSLYGAVPGTGLADWPLTYEELQPYYTRVEWEIGVSGAPGPFDAPRSRPFPLPPMPVKSSGVLLERGARKLGLHPQPAPLAILSQPYAGRGACVHCGFCLMFGCEVGAKSSTLATMIPLAEATGRCELRTECTAFRIETDAHGRAREVLYYDAQGREQGQKARAVILSANGGETPRLLLMSASPKFPDGLANSSGLVGKYLMFNGHASAHAFFEEPLNDYKSVQCTRVIFDFYEADHARGFYGGGGIDARPFLSATPIFFALSGLPPDAPAWGPEYKRAIARYFTRNMAVLSSTTSLPRATNNISLDPTAVDVHGLPAIRVTYEDHPDDLAMAAFLQGKSVDILHAAGASKVWTAPVVSQNVTAHLLGTCRMGDDPQASVVDRWHRSHDVPNLFVCDGSSLVTSGRGQPTMTIQALAFRAAEHIAAEARKGEI
jgi:choline dehydrogenase-like flavoprotein